MNAGEFRFSAWDHYRFVNTITLPFEDANNTHHSEQILALYRVNILAHVVREHMVIYAFPFQSLYLVKIPFLCMCYY